MRKQLLLGALLAASPALCAAQEPLRRVRVESAAAASLAAELETQGFDVLEGTVLAGSLELAVGSAELAALERRGLSPAVLEVGQPYAKKAAQDGVPAAYPDLAEIEARLALAAASYPGLAQLFDLTATLGVPPTVEGRHLYALKLSDHVAQSEDEPAALIVAEQHAREIVTPVTALLLIERWLALYGADPEITALLDANELWVAPAWNPDGYAYVFEVDNLWRKNRRVFATGVGVDLNRNFPLGWDAVCAGESFPDSSTYKGPSPASEAETLTLLAFAAERRFAKVIDLHSSGQEVLWAYNCLAHPFAQYLHDEAVQLSFAAGYGGEERPPSAEGELYEEELAQRGAWSFLIETAQEFQPSYAAALAESEQLLPAFQYALERPIPISGHVTDACTGEPLAAELKLAGVAFTNGETNGSGGPFGSYHAFLPPGPFTLSFSRPGYATAQHAVSVPAQGALVLDVVLAPAGSVGISGQPQPGKTLALDFAMPADPGAFFVAGAGLSGTAPGIPFGACTLPINPDGVTLISIQSHPPFAGFSGLLDASGHAAGAVAIPDTPAVVGLALDFAFVTLDPASGAPLHPSAAKHLVIGS